MPNEILGQQGMHRGLCAKSRQAFCQKAVLQSVAAAEGISLDVDVLSGPLVLLTMTKCCVCCKDIKEPSERVGSGSELACGHSLCLPEGDGILICHCDDVSAVLGAGLRNLAQAQCHLGILQTHGALAVALGHAIAAIAPAG